MNSIICYAVLLLIPCNVLAQSGQDLKFRVKKKFIDKVEVFGGPGLYIPNDHGWAEFVFKESDGMTIYKANSEIGYQMGLSIVHSINSRFEIQGKFSLEKTKYSERDVTLDNNGKPYGDSFSDQKNNYLSFSLMPSYFFLETRRFHVFAGFSCSYLIQSLSYGDTYINGQYVGSASVNTIDGFEKFVLNTVTGVGYFLPLNEKIDCALRIQGAYGLSNSIAQNSYKISVNSVSISLAIRYTR